MPDWKPEGAILLEPPAEEAWKPEGAIALDAPVVSAPSEPKPAATRMATVAPTSLAGIRAATTGRAENMRTLHESTGLGYGKLAKIDYDVRHLIRPMGYPGTQSGLSEEEANAVAGDVANAIKETPDNLYVGGMMFSEGILGAAQWMADLYGTIRPKGVDELVGRGMASFAGVKGPMPSGVTPEQVAAFLESKAKARTDAQSAATWENAPVTKLTRKVVQQGVPSMTVALGMSLVTGSPVVGLAVLSESSAGQEYLTQKQAGAGLGKASVLATLNGAAELGGEMLVFPKFVKGLTRGIPLRNAIALIGENYGQEFATGFTQTMLTEIGSKTSKGMDLEEAARTSLDDAWENAKESGLVGAVTAGLVDVASIPASYYLTASELAAGQKGEQSAVTPPEQAIQEAMNLQAVFDRYNVPPEAQNEIKEAVHVESTVPVESGPAAVAAGVPQAQVGQTPQAVGEVPAAKGEATAGQAQAVAETPVKQAAPSVKESVTVAPEQAGEKGGQQPAPQAEIGQPAKPGATVETVEGQYRKARTRELSKTTKAIKSSAEYKLAVDQREEIGATTLGGIPVLYIPKNMASDAEAYGGEKNAKSEFWKHITHDPKAGVHYDAWMQEETGAYEGRGGEAVSFDDAMRRLQQMIEANVEPDLVDVAQASGNPELEAHATKRAMLQAGKDFAEINATIREDLNNWRGPDGRTLEAGDVAAIMAKVEIQEAGANEISVGAAAGNWQSRSRALTRAYELSRKTKKPTYVVQRSDGSFATQPKPPAKGHYTYVDAAKGVGEDVVFIKQASPTVEEAFDYGEHPAESMKHLSELDRFKKRLATKTDQTEAIRNEMYDYIRANVPPAQQGKFIPLLNRITPGRQMRTNLKDLVRAITQTEELLKGLDKRDAVRELKNTWSEVRTRLKTMDQATQARFKTIMVDIDLAKISEGKKADLASLSKYMNRLAEAVAQGQMEETAAQDAVMSIPRARIDALQRLGKTPLSEMDVEDIRRIGEELSSLVHQYDLKRKLVGNRRRMERATALRETVSEVTQAPGTEPPTTETGVLRHGWFTRFFTVASAHLDTLAERITRPGDTTTTHILVKDIWDGWRERTSVKRRATRALQVGVKAAAFTADEFGALSEPVSVQIGGQAQKIARFELLSLYMHAKSESNVREILKAKSLEFNGVKVPTFTDFTEMIDAVGQLTAKEQSLGDLWTQVNTDVLAPAINAASMQLEGRELATDPTYWRRGRVFPKSVAGRIADVAIEDTGPFQPRTGGTAPIEIVPFHVAVAEAIDAASAYAGMAVPMYNARSVVNTAEWQDAVERAGHADSMNAIFTLYRRMQNYATDTGIVDAMGKKLLTRFGASRLSLRISSMVGQYAGIPVAATEIPAKYFVGVRPSRKLLERCMEIDPVLDARWNQHHMNLEAGNMALTAGYRGLFFGTQPLLDKPLNLLSRADGQVGSIMAGAIANRLRAEQPSLVPGSDAFDTEVALQLEYVIHRSQGSWDIVDRSVMLSDATLASRSIGMFRTAMEAQWNVLLRAINRYQKSERTAEDLAQLGKDMGLVVTGAVIESTLKTALKVGIPFGIWATLGALGLHSPDDEPEDTAKTVTNLTVKTGENILSIVPGGNWLGGLISMIAKAAQGANRWGSEPLPGALDALRNETLTLIPDAIEMGRNMVTGETYDSGPNKDEPKWHRNAENVAIKTMDVVSMVTGAPFSGPITEFRGPASMILDAARIHGMSAPDIRREIYLNTYRQTTKEHKSGDPRERSEKYVNMLKTELGKR